MGRHHGLVPWWYVAPKASGDIRLCLDMRKANAAIIRERIPILTVDEVLECSVFKTGPSSRISAD